MSNTTDIVIGIDGGGSKTRVIAADLNGNILGYAQGGAAFKLKDPSAADNVQHAIAKALSAANRTPENVRSLLAGVAGYDRPSDLQWIETLTIDTGITCPRFHVNDAVIAHAAAFGDGPGIVIIVGSGSIIFGITQAGRQVRNYDFLHYAPTAARFLGLNAAHELLGGDIDASDEKLISQILRNWDAPTLEKFREMAAGGFLPNGIERDAIMSALAPLITAAAGEGSRLAQRLCDRAVDQLMLGVKLLSPLFELQPVSVALIGGVANSAYFKQHLSRRLRDENYTVVEPLLPPVAGAVLLALKHLDVAIDDALIKNLTADQYPGRGRRASIS